MTNQSRAAQAIAAARRICQRDHDWEVPDPVERECWYDFVDLSTSPPTMGQCRQRADGTWEQAPFGDYVILALVRRDDKPTKRRRKTG